MFYCRKKVSVCCQRWSFAVPFLLYMILFGVTWMLSFPLKSLPQQIGPIYSQTEIKKLTNHVDAVRLERDGDVNINFHKDVIIGDVKEGPQYEDPKTLLENIFKNADVSGDGLLSLQELSDWINKKIQEHINEALRDNFGLFDAIDNNPKNGVISWEEYHTYFLRQKGFSKEYAENHDKKHRGLNRSIKEAVMRDRASWSEAAHSDPDHLTLDEFLSFRHPESSHATIIALVDELLDKFDRDGDEILTEDEFSVLQTEGDGEKEGETLTQGEDERRKEFRDVIDRNHDGKADRKELLMYNDPKNPRHAHEEAVALLVLSDADHDGSLSLQEILNKMDLFLGSKMVDTAYSFHDEF
ncbi:45 kDa calcium-binding protein isoform X2 [Zootermopsis nevadensis]|uniref:45 kDa calcium-binding protein n=1 Tax=Zootermopsis nevadensis TaxID=136037 RepID=A0A067QJZ5_ZOONE|nr:45 kDa calcium-binding protein isoform X2 [Zootermopsis nevadensis]KDR09191.1 45 kDa calcium-binding protein [Zootermopsis nevadensis]